jgi:hypothetical protein
MKLTLDQKIQIIHDGARECSLDGHVAVAEKKSELSTLAEKGMGMFDWYKSISHKNSYLYFDSVDACFYISDNNRACVIFSAKWIVGSKDLSIERFEKAIANINKMLETMQCKINELI